jgi:hypothetical protein
MSTDTLWRAPDIVPAITYSDVPRAVEWHRDTLLGEGKRPASVPAAPGT